MSDDLNLSLDIIARFKQQGQHMDITKLQVFLCIARNPHCNRPVIEAATGLTQSTVSRVTQSLGAGQARSKAQGLGLVVGYPDREDPRRLCYVLSAEGRKLFKEFQRPSSRA